MNLVSYCIILKIMYNFVMINSFKFHQAKKSVFQYWPEKIDIKNISRLSEYSTAYVYYDEDTIYKILENKTLWFKHISHFDAVDIYENKAFWSKFTLILDKDKYCDRFKELFDEVISGFQNSIKITIPYYVLCASYKEDNWACWNIFTKKCSKYGAALGFAKESIKHMFDGKQCFNYGFVIYDNNDKREIFNSIMNELFILWSDSNDSDKDVQLKDHFKSVILEASVMFKSSFYESEKEIRYIINEKYIYELADSDWVKKDEELNVYKVTIAKDRFKSLHCTSSLQMIGFNEMIARTKNEKLRVKPSQIITAEENFFENIEKELL